MGEFSLRVGKVSVGRVEEMYGPAFPATMLMPKWDPAIREEISHAVVGQFVNDDDFAMVSVHTWVVRTPQKTILIDTCNGNHKQRAIEEMGNLDTDWLQRLIATGVRLQDVDAVVCTHLHLDHVGWNTTLEGGEWVPTFPNATYYMNRTEYEFWNPSTHDQTGLEFNANVFDDTVKPVFDRDLVRLWDGDGCE